MTTHTTWKAVHRGWGSHRWSVYWTLVDTARPDESAIIGSVELDDGHTPAEVTAALTVLVKDWRGYLDRRAVRDMCAVADSMEGA